MSSEEKKESGLVLKRNVTESVTVQLPDGKTLRITVLKANSGDKPSVTLHFCGDKQTFQIYRNLD